MILDVISDEPPAPIEDASGVPEGNVARSPLFELESARCGKQ
jgi:hypothetical protein